jgi:Zn-dependent alcohol dehydrogenase
MRAALIEPGRSGLQIEEIDIADPGPGQVRVRVHFCSVCHSDYSVATRGQGRGLTVLGHEAAGVVESIGPGVTSVAPGDRVVISPTAPCGHCWYCVRAQPSQCVENAKAMYAWTFPDGTTGLSRGGETVYRGMGAGGFADYVLAFEYAVVRVPSDTPLDIACVIGCAVQTGVGAALNTAAVQPGASVLVLGLGGVGMCVVQGARAAGAALVIGCDLVPGRRQAALGMGATDVIDPVEQDVVTATREMTEVGADYAFDAAGVAGLGQIGLEAIRPGGTMVLVGVPGAEEALTLQPVGAFVVAEKKLLGCLMGGCNPLRDIPRYLAMWQSGSLDLESLVTNRRPVGEINEAFGDLGRGIGIRTAVSFVD